jgi:uncharacterized protein
MPVRVSYPGVYVQEVPSGVRTITGVSTSTAAFVGMVQRGRLKIPTRVLSIRDYERKFGTDTIASEMTDQVRQFFLNGGQEAWIVRIANGAMTAAVQLREETGTNSVMTVRAKEAGPDGNSIRVEVDYNTARPEQTFNLRVFRPVTNAFGVVQIETDETFSNLSMNPSSGNYVETIVNQQSELVEVTVASGLSLGQGYSLSGLLLDNVTALATLNTILSPTVNSIQIAVDGSPLVPVVLPQPLNVIQDLEDAINLALTPFAKNVSVNVVAAGLTTTVRYLEIRSVDGGGSVEIQPAASNDATAALQLGVAQGGIEVSGHAVVRPAPSGFFARLGTGGGVNALSAFAEASDLGAWTLNDASGSAPHTNTPTFARPGSPMYDGTAYDLSLATNPGEGSLRNVRQNLQILVDSINANAKTVVGGQNLWQASLQGYRLVLRPLFGSNNSNVDTTATLTSDGAYVLGANGQLFDSTPPPPSSANVLSYSLGSTGTGNFQTAGATGTPGGIPGPTEYSEAFDIIDRTVDLFNLLIMPRANGQSDSSREALWGIASAFCLRRRAFLLVDPRSTWENTNTVESEIDQLRIGLIKDHSAVYWPRVRIPSASGGLRTIDPSGSIAGVMARIDSNRGVWKAPAGIEASIINIRALEHSMSDPENGTINPKAVNAIRTFPTGIVSWGARTMDGFDNSGNDDYKYVPVRRIALFIEESLFRGLKFAVFEPNDEPLWAQIRLAAGAFMNNLFRQGAFQGQKARDAYFVKVDSETTTQNDINLGIVNVIVGFAPLKPAEFVVISIQQMAGQVQT